MKKLILAAAVILVVYSCSNKSAEYNNKVYLVYSQTQNIISQLGERLEVDSLTNDSAILFINTAENLCDSQLVALKAIKTPKSALEFHTSLEKLLMQQKAHLVLQKRLYNDAEPGAEFSTLTDSLDINQVIIDSLDAQTKTKQLQFAKANGFKLQ